MITPPKFVTEHEKQAEAILKAGFVKQPVFSRGTYHIEIQEKGKKKAFAFLQLSDEGVVRDCFCSCKASESGNGCLHLAAAYLRIFNGQSSPLHVRFKQSLWNKLFQLEAKRLGDNPQALKVDEEGRYHCYSSVKKDLFSLQPLTAEAKKQVKEITTERKKETEETSIKFSDLTSEEIEQYKLGNASYQLKYELSFWSDFAKWLMFLQDEGVQYQIVFSGDPLPHRLEVRFVDVVLQFYISEVHLPWIIPSFKTVKVPFDVVDTQGDFIDFIVYQAASKSLHIHKKKDIEVQSQTSGGMPVGDWIYFKDKGFYKNVRSPLMDLDVVNAAQIPELLNQAARDLSRYLPISLDPVELKYNLFFDSQANLHVRMYVFDPLDLSCEDSELFIPWVYLSGKGFFLVEHWMFHEKEVFIAKAKVADFVNQHRAWLHQFEGFQTHIGSLESRLTYALTCDEELLFDVELSFSPDDAIVFDEWIFVRNQGFFLKRDSGRLPLHPGMQVPKYEISNFITQHKDELEHVHGFFSSKVPVAQMGLCVSINEEGSLVISLKIEYLPEIDPQKVHFYGDYFYVEGQGFSPIPHSFSVPEKYRKQYTVPKNQEASFLAYELEPLRAFILEMDDRLKKPAKLQLKVRKISKDLKKREGQWLVDLAYESELGVTDVFPIWDALFEKERYVFSKAGFLLLKDGRFNWLKSISKRRLDRKRGLVRLNTLEWIRLSAFENIKDSKGTDPSAVEMRKLFDEINRLETSRALDITGLKSSLRPYQELGVNWLWFLYCHGLSGLLCDDMGLGKTHQAMALLAAIVNSDADKRNKYLVVCPTSVIYHWQELLKKFLPSIRVCTYYGVSRSLEDFDSNYDLLLTSYGILRQASDVIDPFFFEAAFFDEIQVAKNYASQTHQALSRVKAQMKLGLTGTPIENRLREIKSLFDVVLPSYMPNDVAFRDLFIKPIEKDNDESKKALLGRLIKPFILRRKKSEVLKDLPEKIEEISYCDLSVDQQKLYFEIANQMKETVYRDLKDETKPVPYIHVFSALSKLKQICDHPILLGDSCKDYQKVQSGKWDLFIELLQEALDSGQKVVVFSQYLEMLAIMELYLKKQGIGFASIKGSTRDRNEQLRKFREDPKCQVFLASLLAAGVGIDLTVASIVIHYDRWWNPAKENQATDRVHRIGQNRGVQVFKLVTKDTIEEHIHEVIEMKKGLLEDIVGADDQIHYLSREELIKVFDKMFKNIP